MIYFLATMKTVFMNFKPSKMKMKDPTLYLNNEQLNFEKCTKYLGIYIEECGTNKDVNRQLRKIYGKANIVLPK